MKLCQCVNCREVKLCGNMRVQSKGGWARVCGDCWEVVMSSAGVQNYENKDRELQTGGGVRVIRGTESLA